MKTNYQTFGPFEDIETHHEEVNRIASELILLLSSARKNKTAMRALKLAKKAVRKKSQSFSSYVSLSKQ